MCVEMPQESGSLPSFYIRGKICIIRGQRVGQQGVSQSGWMEEVNYLKWFEKHFYPAVRHVLETGPVMLFFDGHFSHMSITLIKRAQDLGIHLFCLPPNTTRVTTTGCGCIWTHETMLEDYLKELQNVH